MNSFEFLRNFTKQKEFYLKLTWWSIFCSSVVTTIMSCNACEYKFKYASRRQGLSWKLCTAPFTVTMMWKEILAFVLMMVDWHWRTNHFNQFLWYFVWKNLKSGSRTRSLPVCQTSLKNGNLKKGIKGLKRQKAICTWHDMHAHYYFSTATMQNTSEKTRQWESWKLSEEIYKRFCMHFFVFAIDTLYHIPSSSWFPPLGILSVLQSHCL